jgi:hypothetical protein
LNLVSENKARSYPVSVGFKHLREYLLPWG